MNDRRRYGFPLVFMSLLTLFTDNCLLSDSKALLLLYLNMEIFTRQIETLTLTLFTSLFRNSGNSKQSGHSLTSTQVSISLYWFITGSMVSMLLCSTRSDLFPTRIRGTLDKHTHTHTDHCINTKNDIKCTFNRYTF